MLNRTMVVYLAANLAITQRASGRSGRSAVVLQVRARGLRGKERRRLRDLEASTSTAQHCDCGGARIDSECYLEALQERQVPHWVGWVQRESA